MWTILAASLAHGGRLLFTRALPWAGRKGLSYLPWIGKQVRKRPLITTTAAHIATDGESTTLLRNCLEIAGEQTLDAISNIDHETADFIKGGVKSGVQETFQAWQEMSAEGGILLKNMGTDVADQAGENLDLFMRKNPVKGMARRDFLTDAMNDIDVSLSVPVEGSLQETNTEPSTEEIEPQKNAETFNITDAFQDAVHDVETGALKLDWFEDFRFDVMAGLARLFNSVNFFGMTDSLVRHFQSEAIEITQEEDYLAQHKTPPIQSM